MKSKLFILLSMIFVLNLFISPQIVEAGKIVQKEIEYYIPQKAVTPRGISGRIKIWGYDEDDEQDEGFDIISPVYVKLKSISATVNGKTYKGKITATPGSSSDQCNHFSIKYLCDYDTKITISAVDEHDCEYKKIYKVKNQDFKLFVDPVYYESKVITGQTVAKSDITVFVAESSDASFDKKRRKEYHAVAGSSGKFKIKIPKQKIGTYIFVGVATPEGFSKYKELSVTQEKSSITVKYAYNGDTAVHGHYTKAKKGDYIVYKCGGKESKVKVSSTKDKYSFTINVPPCKTGKKYSVSVYNRYGQKKLHLDDRIYSTHKLKVGMSIETVRASDWGAPDEIYTTEIGNSTYVSYFYYDMYGHSCTLVNFKNGVVYSITYSS